jgi:hypothetical protein
MTPPLHLRLTKLLSYIFSQLRWQWTIQRVMMTPRPLNYLFTVRGLISIQCTQPHSTLSTPYRVFKELSSLKWQMKSSTPFFTATYTIILPLTCPDTIKVC